MYVLYTAPGSGGMIVEAALTIADLPVEIVTVAWDDLGWNSEALRELNPLGQLPTLRLPDGTVMTESAAMLLHAADVAPDGALAPTGDDPLRPSFLRTLMFLASAVYPTFTYGDVPDRWVEADAEAAAKLRRGTDEHRLTLYRHLEQQCGAPWFLGGTFSGLDLYFWVMRNWRPGRQWFAESCPRLDAVAERAATLPGVRRVDARNFPPGSA